MACEFSDCADPARRRLFSVAAASLPAGLMLLGGGAFAAERAAGAAPPRKLELTERSVLLSGDGVPMTAQAWVAQLQALLERDAEVKDVYLGKGVVQALEARLAARLGKAAAVFLPTGTLANTLALRVLCGENRHALVQHESHVYLDESNAASTLSGLHLVPLAKGRAAPTPEEVRAAIDEAENGPYPLKVGAISLESPVRRADGAMVPYGTARAISELARGKRIGLHLDGARLLLASGLPGFEIRAYSALFDTVYVSLYKYLGAPFGAILAGETDTIDKVRALRHVFGGTIFRGWPAALPALDALDGFEARYLEARAAAERLFAGLAAAGGFTPQPVEHGTNVAFLAVSPERANGLVERLRRADVHLRDIEQGRVQIDTNLTLLRRSPEELIRAFTAPG
ncbi:threonine aldolase family protein [Luteimonas aquatica]|uniref:threonine aldolase family protein n=1 Tax=Luteimonas aquatica TaxID=450364 RepID=UPI001F5A2EF8|nr:beta-eliminating lyase-related protein [Luteimonas aquatica]